MPSETLSTLSPAPTGIVGRMEKWLNRQITAMSEARARAARASTPNSRFVAMRQLNLKCCNDVLRYAILQLEDVVEIALETVGPNVAAIHAVD